MTERREQHWDDPVQVSWDEVEQAMAALRLDISNGGGRDSLMRLMVEYSKERRCTLLTIERLRRDTEGRLELWTETKEIRVR